MVTRRLAIKEKNRSHPIAVVGPTDFVYELGDEIEPEEVLRDPKFSLYCVDPKNGVVLFVECDDPLAVDQAPFYYQAQVQHAIGLVSMPVTEFHRVADEIPEPPKGLILVHSTSRCGSTLLSKVLGAISSIHSLSEPDDLTQMVHLKVAGEASDDELSRLLVSSIKWRCKPRFGAPTEQVAIKTRGEVLVLADLIAASFPRAKHFFMYRDATSWMGSLFRGYSPERDPYDKELNRKMAESWSRTIPLVREFLLEDVPINQVEIRVLAWITCMEGYLKLREIGVPTCAARFEDLTACPIPILEQVLEFCGIEGVDWDTIHDVLGKDSQAGTVYDREGRRLKNRQLTPELVRDVRNMVSSRPLLRESSIVLPGTINLALHPNADDIS